MTLRPSIISLVLTLSLSLLSLTFVFYSGALINKRGFTNFHLLWLPFTPNSSLPTDSPALPNDKLCPPVSHTTTRLRPPSHPHPLHSKNENIKPPNQKTLP